MSKTTEDHRAPLARTEELVVQELPDEVLVYDLRSHKAHCLNKASALVWNHCDGRTTPAQMAKLLEKECGEQVSEDAVWFALNKLSKADLLSERIMLPQARAGLSRRSAIRRLGLGALMIPAVISIVAPTAVSAASIPAACNVCSMHLATTGVCPGACGSTVIGRCFADDGCGGPAGASESCPACQSSGGRSWIAP